MRSHSKTMAQVEKIARRWFKGEKFVAFQSFREKFRRQARLHKLKLKMVQRMVHRHSSVTCACNDMAALLTVRHCV